MVLRWSSENRLEKKLPADTGSFFLISSLFPVAAVLLVMLGILFYKLFRKRV